MKTYTHSNGVTINVKNGQSVLMINGSDIDKGHSMKSIHLSAEENIITFDLKYPNPDDAYSDDLLSTWFDLDLAQTAALIGALKFFKKNLEKSIEF